MLFVRGPADQVDALGQWMRSHDVLMSVGPVTRIVTHLDAERPALEKVLSHWRAFLAQHRPGAPVTPSSLAASPYASR